MSKVISLINQKGGVGKTTTAINLAASLGEAGQRVLLVDFDPQGNTTGGIAPEGDGEGRTIYDLICGNATVSECLIKDVSEGVDLIPADIDLSGAEIELHEIENGEKTLKEAIKNIKRNYDFVFIDCPPSIGTLTINALTASDGAIIPVQCEYYALEGLSQVLDTIEIVRQKLNTRLKIFGILFTMYDARTNLSDQVIQSVRQSLKAPIFETVIPRNVRLAEAPSHGEPITVYDPSSRGAESYRLLASELLRER